jgi:hypothetical protein
VSTINPATGLPYPNTTTTATAPATIPTDTGGYISLPVTVDPYQLTADAFGFIANQIPGWVPPEGALETWIIYACARMVAQLAQTAAQVPDVIFEYLGGALMGVPPNQGAAAECQTTWTMVDTSGYTVPAGTVVAFATSGNTVVQYATLQAFSVPEGQTSTAAGAVTVQAAAIGAAANGIAAGPMVIVDQLAFVSSVTSTTTTAGGADPETTAQYLNQLAARFQLLTPRPVLAADFAVMAAQVAGVNRALGIDNYNPYANMLTALDASYGTSGASVGSFTATANCTVATSNAWAETGTYSLSMVATAGGSMTCQSGWYPIAGGETYTAMAFFHAATVAAECAVDLVWGDVNQNVLSTSAGTTSDDSTGGGVQVTNTATAPSNASYLKLQPRVTAGSAGETHDCDERGVLLGTTTTWGPGGAQTGQERMVTVVPVDVNGNALTDDEMAAISTELESLREVNFVVNIVPPTYTAVNVTAAVVCQPSASLATVQAAVVTALQAYLAPGTWAGGGQIPPVWLNDNTVYYLDVAGVIINVPGVHHIVAGSLTVNGGTADVPLDGLAALPQPDINVTVTAAAAGT